MHMFSGYGKNEDDSYKKQPYEPGPLSYKSEWPHEMTNSKVKKIKKDYTLTPFGRWVKRVEKPHVCVTPTASFVKGVEAGSIWECGACKQQWRLTSVTESKVKFEEYPAHITAFCVNCKGTVPIENRVTRVSDSGRKMAHGNCPNCHTKVNRILGKDAL